MGGYRIDGRTHGCLSRETADGCVPMYTQINE